MADHPNYEKVQRALRDHGGLYTIEDIFECLEDGRMQSFAHNDTWVVTEIREYPNGTNLEIIFVAGNMADARVIEEQLIEFCEEQGIDRMVSESTRPGWIRARFPGWKHMSMKFVKEIGHGRRRRRNTEVSH